jgi:hypothetical protein
MMVSTTKTGRTTQMDTLGNRIENDLMSIKLLPYDPLLIMLSAIIACALSCYL